MLDRLRNIARARFALGADHGGALVDAAQRLAQIATAADKIRLGKADVVFGSRFMGQYKPRSFIFNLHYLINKFFTIVCNVLSGYHTTDMWTGYKMYSRRALDAFLPYLTSNGVAFEPEITILLAKLGFRITDVPISFNPRWYEEGKKMNWKQAIRSFYKMVGFAFRKIPKQQ